jgi:hypothetical protein
MVVEEFGKKRERNERSEFPLEKTTPNFRDAAVLRALINFCHRPALRFGLRTDRRGRFRDPRFASFIGQNNRTKLDTDFHDTVLRGRKVMKNIFRLALAGGVTWVVVESAKALSVF